MNEKKEEILQKRPFWEHLTKIQKELLLREARIVRYQAGNSIYSSVRECLGAVFILEGIMRTYLLSDEGKEVTMYRLREGDCCVLAASCILSAITFDVEIEAQTDCVALVIPAGLLAAVSRENVYMDTAKRFSDVVEALQQMIFLSLTQRVVSFLLDESSKSGSSTITMTHEEIAKIIGSAREAVSRTLKQLAKNGCIALNRGEIILKKKEELYRLL